MDYKTIKDYYLMGLFTKENLEIFVNPCKWITEEQKQEIIKSKEEV